MKRGKGLILILVTAIMLSAIPVCAAEKVELSFDCDPAYAAIEITGGKAYLGNYTVPGDGSYSFTATADGYEDYSGTFDVLDGRVSFNGVECGGNVIHIVMNKKTYPVLITKNPSSMTLIVTDAYGNEVDDTSYLSSGTYLYSAYAEGYESAAGKFSVENAPTVLNISLKAVTQSAPTTSGIGALALAPANVAGEYYSAPVASPNEVISLYLPVINNGESLTDITIEPVVSSNVEEFPFVAEVANYGLKLPNLENGAWAVAQYTFKVSPYATNGVKTVQFRAIYRENGVLTESTLSASVTIKNGYEAPQTSVETAPRLIVSGYALDKETVYAGEDFVLTLFVKNTSASNEAMNVTSSLTLDPSAVMPSLGQSDINFASSIKPNDTAELSYKLTAMADIQGNAQIAIKLDYDNGEGITGSSSQTITLPIKQHMRISVDSPEIYADGAKEGELIAVSLPIINKGKTKAYNVEVKLESAKLAMQEGYFGGDILPGAKHSAEFQLLCLEGGLAEGVLTVSFEDAEGNTYEQSVDLSVNIDYVATQPVQSNIEEVQKEADTAAWPIIICVVAGIAAVVIALLFIIKKGKRNADR